MGLILGGGPTPDAGKRRAAGPGPGRRAASSPGTLVVRLEAPRRVLPTYNRAGRRKLRSTWIAWKCGPGRPRSDDEAPVLLEDLAVDHDPAALAQVADHVAVHGALV